MTLSILRQSLKNDSGIPFFSDLPPGYGVIYVYSAIHNTPEPLQDYPGAIIFQEIERVERSEEEQQWLDSLLVFEFLPSPSKPPKNYRAARISRTDYGLPPEKFRWPNIPDSYFLNLPLLFRKFSGPLDEELLKDFTRVDQDPS